LSSDRQSGIAPVGETRPKVGRSPVAPQRIDGWRDGTAGFTGFPSDRRGSKRVAGATECKLDLASDIVGICLRSELV
jgi:hypothetical protein